MTPAGPVERGDLLPLRVAATMSATAAEGAIGHPSPQILELLEEVTRPLPPSAPANGEPR